MSNWLTAPLFLAEVGPAGRALETALQALTNGALQVEVDSVRAQLLRQPDVPLRRIQRPLDGTAVSVFLKEG